MKFIWSTLHVNDLEESVRFYQEIVGLEVDHRFHAGPGKEIVFLGRGETKVELIREEGRAKTSVGPDICWGFEVESVDAMLETLKEKGVPVHSGPFQPNPFRKFFYILDPNGMRIQFVENLQRS